MAGEIVKAEQVLRVGQRMEFFVEGSDDKYTSRVEDIKDGKIYVAMPVNKKRVPVIPRTGEKLYSLAVGDQCRYRFFTKFLKTMRMDGRIPAWEIEMPDTVERHQNRSFVRVRTNLPIRLRLVDEEGRIGESVETRMIDLSGSGVSFIMQKEVKTGLQAGLEIDNLPEIGTLDVMCDIVRCSKVNLDDEHFVYHVGAKFNHLSRAIINRIVRYTFTVQRRVIAKGITEI